jgi:peptidoglycan/xylan/chitin deacetylase (PgdA/CDA1 family)
MKTARALPLLMYHHVSPSPGLVTLSPQNFRAQMSWLARNAWRTIGADELAAFLSGQPLGEKSLMLTFDDGWLDNWLYAHPILQEFGLNAVLFLITGWLAEGPPRALRKVGTGETAANSITAMPAHRVCMEKVKTGGADDVMLRWSEVQAMRAAGTFEFHSHTHTHTRWDKLVGDPSERAARLAEDLAASRRALQKHLGEVSGHLCWPQGYYDADWQGRAHAAGFTYLYTVMPGTCTPDTAADAIPRIVVKDRNAGWFGRRLWLYRQPALTRAYLAVQGKSVA